MSLISQLFGSDTPNNLGDLLDACERLIEEGSSQAASDLARRYALKIGTRGIPVSPNDYFELGAASLFALCADDVVCEGLPVAELPEAISAIALRRRNVAALLDRARELNALSAQAVHYADVAEGIVNMLEKKHGDRVDVADLIARGDGMFYALRAQGQLKGL